MALMSEERRKEMEEEMNRFELEIAVPGEGDKSSAVPHATVAASSKPLSPPPAPPSVAALIPKILSKPPPPPPSTSPPTQAPLRPPPPPPHFQAQPQAAAPVRFIPAQVQRQPPRPQARPNFMGMRGPPGPFHPQGHMGHHFGPPMGHMGGPHMHQGGPMHGGPMMQMQHGPMHMSHMQHQMNMGVNLPLPPGFCPPGPPMNQGNMRFESHFDSGNSNQASESEPPVSSSSSVTESSAVVASAPTIYAAPFKKSLPESVSEDASSNGKEGGAASAVAPATPKSERVSIVKTPNEPSVGPVVSHVAASDETAVTTTTTSRKKEKKKKIVRMAGGQAWEDNSLLEWESDDFRIFCGDLGNDVTDEVLIRAFSKYTSFVKAKVVRDKRTNKTKGFGFVSFKDPQDFIKAMREMNGRYVGSRPIKLRKSTWRDRNIDIVKKKQREKEKLGLL